MAFIRSTLVLLTKQQFKSAIKDIHRQLKEQNSVNEKPPKLSTTQEAVISTLDFNHNFQYTNNEWGERFATIILPWSFNGQPLDKDGIVLSNALIEHCEECIVIEMDSRACQADYQKRAEQVALIEHRIEELEKQLEPATESVFSVSEWFKVKPHFVRLRAELTSLKLELDDLDNEAEEVILTILNQEGISNTLSKWIKMSGNDGLFRPQKERHLKFLSLFRVVIPYSDYRKLIQ